MNTQRTRKATHYRTREDKIIHPEPRTEPKVCALKMGTGEDKERKCGGQDRKGVRVGQVEFRVIYPSSG